MARRQRDSKREAFWRRAVRRREKSGLTVVEFCRREDLSPTTYHFWRREIHRRDAESTSPNSDRKAMATLVPVHVVDDQRAAAPIEIVAGNGYAIRVSEAATSEHLRRVLQIVSELD